MCSMWINLNNQGVHSGQTPIVGLEPMTCQIRYQSPVLIAHFNFCAKLPTSIKEVFVIIILSLGFFLWIVKDNDPPPLCYKFKFLPNGLYDRLIACAAQKSEWSVYGNMLFHGYARFELDKAHVLTFTREKESIVTQIHVFLPSPDETRTRSICVKTKKDINDILTMQIKKYCPQVTFDLCVTCDCKAGDPALIDIGVSEFDMILGEAIVCKVHHKSISTAPYGIWYKTFGEEVNPQSNSVVKIDWKVTNDNKEGKSNIVYKILKNIFPSNLLSLVYYPWYNCMQNISLSFLIWFSKITYRRFEIICDLHRSNIPSHKILNI